MLLLYIPLVHPPQDKAQIERTQNHETGDDNTPGSKPAAIGTGHIVRLITRMKSTRHQVPGAGAGMNVWFKEKWQRETIQYLNRVSIDGKKMTG